MGHLTGTRRKASFKMSRYLPSLERHDATGDTSHVADNSRDEVMVRDLTLIWSWMDVGSWTEAICGITLLTIHLGETRIKN
jgi:hypothetical protein